MDTAELASMEAELTAQLQEQQEAAAAIAEVLAADVDNEEMQQMQEQLAAAVRETEQALLQLTRDRLLRQLDGMGSGGSGIGPGPGSQSEQQQQQQQQQRWQPGQRCVFRSTDGRYHPGVVEGVAEDLVTLRFATPMRQHQLAPQQLPAEALAAPRDPPLALHQLELGVRVILQPPGTELWVRGEVAGLDPAAGRVEAVTEEGVRVVVPVAQVALSAYAPDPWDSDHSDGSGGVDGSGSSSSGEEEEGSDVFDSEGSSEDGGSEDEDSTPYARVALALSGAAAQAQAAAEAGPQTDTRLFSSWEEHTRGIGSKMLAAMGFRGGGLGREQRGIAAPLEAAQLKKGAGLGVEPGKKTREGKKKRKRGGGRKARQQKEAFDQREAKRQAQRELEQRTGAEGVFASINAMIGDASQAAAIRRAEAEEAGGAGSGGGGMGGRNAHLFQPSGGAKAAAGSKAAKEPDRRALASQQDQLAALRQKVARLGDMAKRNAKDKVMLPQIQRALADAKKQLEAAEQVHSSAQRAVQQKEKERKWVKF